MNTVRRVVLGMTIAATLMAAAWQASANQGLLIGTAAHAEGSQQSGRGSGATGVQIAEPESSLSQPGSLILFGLALAFAGHSLKRQKTTS